MPNGQGFTPAAEMLRSNASLGNPKTVTYLRRGRSLVLKFWFGHMRGNVDTVSGVPPKNEGKTLFQIAANYKKGGETQQQADNNFYQRAHFLRVLLLAGANADIPYPYNGDEDDEEGTALQRAFNAFINGDNCRDMLAFLYMHGSSCKLDMQQDIKRIIADELGDRESNIQRIFEKFAVFVKTYGRTDYLCDTFQTLLDRAGFRYWLKERHATIRFPNTATILCGDGDESFLRFVLEGFKIPDPSIPDLSDAGATNGSSVSDAGATNGSSVARGPHLYL